MSKLENLKKFTTVVCDTGDINSIKKYNPQDATTNPSLIYQATQDSQYEHLVEDAIRFGTEKTSHPRHLMRFILDKLFVNFGCEILKIVPGRVSTEVDARLSFDVHGSIQKAITLVDLYESMGQDRNRVLIKLASTWEGIEAARHLEKEGIHCNMTLLFSLPQAAACAEAKATLISPFVGRIVDWYKIHDKVDSYPLDKNPGVQSVANIYSYYKKFGYETQVMGASFRSIDEILELAGCDLLTIAPKYLQQLASEEGNVTRKLWPNNGENCKLEKLDLDEKAFRYMFNENAMASEKLGDGIRLFAADAHKLEAAIHERIHTKNSCTAKR